MKKATTVTITRAAVITAAYVLLTLPFAQFAFGPIQFRLAEAMTLLPAVFPAAIPGLFLGCFLANLFNPGSLGPIDILFGSFATLLASLATWRIARGFRTGRPMLRRLACAVPPIVLNALIVGSYLPFLLLEEGNRVTTAVLALNIASVGLSEAVVVLVIGLPLLTAMEKRYGTLSANRKSKGE